MAKQNEIVQQEQAGKQSENAINSEPAAPKKLFVEPEISVPVDVLEATTFFQTASSGNTNN